MPAIYTGGKLPTFNIGGFGEPLIEVEIEVNSEDDPDAVLNQIINKFYEGPYDIVLIDDDWGVYGPTVGQDKLLEEAIDNIHGVCPELPVFVLFTEHWDQIERSEKLCGFMNQSAKSQQVTGLRKGDTSGLRLQVNKVVTSEKNAEKLGQSTLGY